MKSHEDPWRSMKIHENPWRSMKIHEDPWRSMKIHEITWNLMEFHEISWNLMKSHQVFRFLYFFWYVLDCCFVSVCFISCFSFYLCFCYQAVGLKCACKKVWFCFLHVIFICYKISNETCSHDWTKLECLIKVFSLLWIIYACLC